MIWIFLPLALQILPRTQILAFHVEQPRSLSRSSSSARPARPFSAREAPAVGFGATAIWRARLEDARRRPTARIRSIIQPGLELLSTARKVWWRRAGRHCRTSHLRSDRGGGEPV